MKQPKRLTREQKVILSAQGLVADNYMLDKETEFYQTELAFPTISSDRKEASS